MAALARAVSQLEHKGFASRLTNALGHEIERLGRMVPANITDVVDRAGESAIRTAFNTALRTLSPRSSTDQRIAHKAVATLSGTVGGAFGLAALPIELPFSTIVMLRSIAAIARASGEDLSQPEAALACLQVFALGTGRENQLALESSYFSVRAVLAKSVSEAARFVVNRGLADEGTPVIVRLVSQIATRFGVVVSQKVAAQAVPVMGAVGGAAVNYAFIDHFQSIAEGHFTVRRLERAYGPQIVRAEYDRLLAETRAKN
ncbi:MAG: EcsC family protein [Methylovirgula sp.]|uniref:EcsC family protein n=1 Tax=Methylovirgula sp. TaxID=1978224 RepID=UPI00307635AD